jgi:hypothetical protein
VSRKVRTVIPAARGPPLASASVANARHRRPPETQDMSPSRLAFLTAKAVMLVWPQATVMVAIRRAGRQLLTTSYTRVSSGTASRSAIDDRSTRTDSPRCGRRLKPTTLAQHGRPGGSGSGTSSGGVPLAVDRPASTRSCPEAGCRRSGLHPWTTASARKADGNAVAASGVEE